MIKATIQNNRYCTDIVFPCTETELAEKIGRIGIDKEQLVPMGTVIDIKPAELSSLINCKVKLDALNYLGKRMDGMDKLEKEKFFAVLSCDELYRLGIEKYYQPHLKYSPVSHLLTA